MMKGGGLILTGGLLLVAIAGVQCQTETELRIIGPVNNITLNTNKVVNYYFISKSKELLGRAVLH